MPTSKNHYYYYAEKIIGATYDLYDGDGFGYGFRTAFRIMKRVDTYGDTYTMGVPTIYARDLTGGSLSQSVVDGSNPTVGWNDGTLSNDVDVSYKSHKITSASTLESDYKKTPRGSRKIGDSLSSTSEIYTGRFVYDNGTELSRTLTLNFSYSESTASRTTTYTITLPSTCRSAAFTYHMYNFEFLPVDNPTKTKFIWSSKTTDFDFTGLRMLLQYYPTDTTGEGEYLPLAKLSVSYNAPDKTASVDNYPFSVSATEPNTNQTCSYSYTSQNSPISCYPLTATLEITSPTGSEPTDSNSYFDNASSKFALPKDSSGNGFVFKLSYNDSQFDKSDIASDNANISYFISGQSDKLTIGQAMTMLSQNATKTDYATTISAAFSIPSGYEPAYSVTSASYAINVTHDEVSKVSFSGTVELIRGNHLTDKNFHPTLTQTYKSGATSDSYTAYSLASGMSDKIYEPSSTPKTIDSFSIIDDTTKATIAVDISKATFTYKNPTPSSIALNNQVQTTYNVLDKVSFGKLTATISYSDAEYKALTDSIQYWDSKAVPTYASGVLYIDSNYDATDNKQNLLKDELSGSVGISKGYITPDVTEYDPNVYFRAKDPFSDTMVLTSLLFKIVGITKIDGLYVYDIYDSYKVGDAFLNDSDTTQATIYYTDTNSSSKSYSGSLNNMMGSLNIYPAKGTILKNQTDSRKVTITSSYDASVTYSYDISVASRYSYSSDTSIASLKPVIMTRAFDYKFYSNDGDELLTHHFAIGDVALILKTDWQNDSIVDKSTLTMVNEDLLATGEDDSRNNIILILGYVNNVYEFSKITKEDYFDNALFQGILGTFHDYKPEVEGQSNITVLFPCKTVEAIGDTVDELKLYPVADYINQSTIGICFGHNNNSNRLWASGNSTKPNFDWHTTEPNSTNDDTEASYSGGYGYFTEESQSKYGETDNKIVGYEIISDSKLIVYKNHSSKEPSIYFRVPKLATAYDSLGNVMKDIDGNTLYQEEYTLSVSNSPIAAISNKSHVNFNGDSLFVDDDNEVAGLDVEGIIGDSQRQGNTRSYYIDKALKECDMGESLMFVSGRTLYLYAPGYGIFVSDRDSKSNSQYEWWLLDDREPTCFFDHSKYVYFGDSNGYIYKIDPTTYKDSQRVFVDDSELLTIYAEDKPSTTNFNEDNRVLVTNQDIISLLNSSSDGRYFRPVTKSSSSNDDNAYMFARVGEANTTYSSNADLFIDQANNVIACKNAKIAKKIGSLKDYYLNYSAMKTEIVTSDVSSFALYKKYKLVPSDKTISSYDNYALYAMQDSNGNALDLSKLSMADVCMKLNGEYKIANVTAYTDGVGGYFSILDDDGDVIDITKYGSQKSAMNFNGEITKYTPVTSKLITAPLLADSGNWFKAVWKIAVTNGANLDSDLDIAYVSNKVIDKDSKTIAAVPISVATVSRASSGFSFEGADFMVMDFSKSLVPRSVAINRAIGHCRSITMMMKSDNPYASVIPTLSITYTIPHPSEGSN